MRPGMGKVFKQIKDVQSKAADEVAPARRNRRS
jgi:ribosomal protein S30